MTARHQDYWDTFYADRASADVPSTPSPFAEWVRDRVAAAEPIIECGFGNARDSFWWARQGHRVRAYDYAHSAVEQAQARAGAEGLDASFGQLDLYDDAAVDAVIAEGAGTGASLYGRFLIHSLEDAGRANLLRLAAGVVRAPQALYVEFRTGKDAEGTHLFGDDHFRIYLDPDQVVAEIEALGGRIVHFEEGHGLAVYKTEDPHVARIVATWDS